MLIPVILSGGVGSRLWPLSREQEPKLFMRLADNESLVQKAFLRGSLLPEVRDVLTVCSQHFWRQIDREYQEVAEPRKLAVKNHFMLEPCSRNTAAAIAMATLWVSRTFGEDTQLLVLPSDHLITPQSLFNEAVERAIALAETGKITLFGIKPTRPDTGYGYLENRADEIIRFVEKPDAKRAEEFYKSGDFLWNAGMFCFQARVMLKEMQQHCAEILVAAEKTAEKTMTEQQGGRTLIKISPENFQAIPQESIDYAVIEKTTSAAVVSSKFDWNDIGNWDTWGELKPADEKGNHIQGPVAIIDSHDNIIFSHRVLGVLGIDNAVIVDTEDALLVANRKNIQQVREIYAQLKKNYPQVVEYHKTIQCPWGSYTVLDEGVNFKVKRIEVHPNGQLSLQSHKHRSEHWTVVSGEATTTIDGKIMVLKPNQSCYINCGEIHRLENKGTKKMILIEVQSGAYLEEDDIIRYEDAYGRSTEDETK